MLILSRHRDEKIVIQLAGDDTTRAIITIVDIRGDKVRLGFDAPPEVIIHRQEIMDRIAREAEEGKQGDAETPPIIQGAKVWMDENTLWKPGDPGDPQNEVTKE